MTLAIRAAAPLAFLLLAAAAPAPVPVEAQRVTITRRSEEHTSELQSH